MAIVSQSRSLLWPPLMPRVEGLITLDANTEKYAVIFQAPASGDITDVVWRTRTVGAGTFTLTIGLQLVDATTGYPDGTYLSSGNAKTTHSSASLASNTAYTETLGTAYTATRGEILALVVEITSYTSGSVQVSNFTPNSTMPSDWIMFPYLTNYIGTPAWARPSGAPYMGVKIGSTIYPCGGYAPNTISTVTAKNDASPYELGNVIIPPWTCQAEGCWVWMVNNADNFDVILYRESDTSVLTSLSVDKDVLYSQKGAYFLFPTAQTLTAGATYRLVLKPTTATASNVGISKLAFTDANMLGMTPAGASVYGCIRTHATNWTWTDYLSSGYAQFCMGLILDGVNIPTLPAAADVIEGAAGDVTGTYHEAAVGEVQSGVAFGPSSSLTGTYAGGGGGGNPTMNGGFI